MSTCTSKSFSFLLDFMNRMERTERMERMEGMDDQYES